MPPALS
jgi:tetratricopeptide (TPR) repeat protein